MRNAQNAFKNLKLRLFFYHGFFFFQYLTIHKNNDFVEYIAYLQ